MVVWYDATFRETASNHKKPRLATVGVYLGERNSAGGEGKSKATDQRRVHAAAHAAN